jgi:hypothetical protein
LISVRGCLRFSSIDFDLVAQLQGNATGKH